MTEVRAKKALGQHFLVDLNIARKICDALSAATLPATGKANPHNPAEGTVNPTGRTAQTATSANRVAQTATPVNPAAEDGTGIPDGTAGVSGVPAEAGAAGACGQNGVPGQTPAPGIAMPQSAPCDVLEVGCGMGVLTQFLLRRGDIVTWGAEIDSESVEYLHAHYPEFAPRLVEGDFLKMDLRERFPRGVKIIGNFPYNISSQIFFKVLENRDLVSECVGMIQKEVAVRLAEKPGSKEYGILSVLLQAWYEIEYLFTVNETVFNPPPKVKSAVVRLRRNDTVRLACDERLFIKVVKASFGQRRKMIRNSLRSVFGDFGAEEHPFFTQRAEQLSVADFVELTSWVARHGSFGPAPKDSAS